jgi:hypothetical protein
MKFKKKYVMTFLSIALNASVIMAQGNIDSFANTLNNAEATSALAWVAPTKIYDSSTRKIYAHSLERVVTSTNLLKIQKTYPKYLMIGKLVQLLDDSNRDWYANLLLYSLTNKSSSNIIGCSSRGDWLKIKTNTKYTYKQIDLEIWHKYFSGLSRSSEY